MLTFAAGLAATAAFAQVGSDLGSHASPAAQAAADYILEAARLSARSSTGIPSVDAAFLPAGLLRATTNSDLATMLQHPTDTVVVVELTGKAIKNAIEHSLANYPQSNSGFLQLGGLTVVFSESAAPDARTVEIKVGDAMLVPERTYHVAMPSTLAYGTLGYFKIWNKDQVVLRTNVTLEQILKGKSGQVRASRYIVRA